MSRSDPFREDRGQTLVIVALMLTLLFGFVGLVADVAWYELNLIRVQRAADAAALAGVVFLPSNLSGAVTAAKNEASKNGFMDGSAGVTISVAPDAVNDRILGVTVRAPVRTFFAQLFGVTAFSARRNGPSGSHLGTGDHWIGPGGTPVTTTFRLWDTQGTPYTAADDVLITDTGSRFAGENQVDKGSDYRGNGSYSDTGYNGSASADCQNDPDHNDWYRLANGLIPGTYRLQVTTSAAGNASTNAENMFGIEVKANAPGARVYGTTK